ncbi:PEP-CTERM sorting domain-containing protein [Geobacter pelophilus]|uniref:PEP-CTERM sorting domain-containing protein n=1 Tax=Geoanaerobacter pelophilus TaxID=60036 RepID=A0AAW4L7S9_9BACT|nr:PEP-CTERM sorting domain-containing protein [Geoanaerobacter pelophilus]MBT0665607.1 PEP-CTERM sorting domain-containing protein [Geoanaerobacter pelophilus]
MKATHSRSIILVVIIGILWATQAFAMPTNYILSGSGYGDLNGDPVFNEVSYKINLATNASTTVDTSTYSGVTYLLGLQGKIGLGPDAFPEPSNTVPYKGYVGNFVDNLYLAFDANSKSLEFGSFDVAANDPGNGDFFGANAFWRFDIGTALNPFAGSGPVTCFIDPAFDPLNATGFMWVSEFTAAMSTGDVLTLGPNTMVYAAPVPEPSTFALIGAGLIGLGFLRKRTSRS